MHFFFRESKRIQRGLQRVNKDQSQKADNLYQPVRNYKGNFDETRTLSGWNSVLYKNAYVRSNSHFPSAKKTQRKRDIALQ